MRRALLVAVVSATACSRTTLPPDAPPLQLQLDVVIADGGVTLYTNASDLAATGCHGQDVFPAPGTTATIDDIVTCQQGNANDSCLSNVSLVIEGTQVTGQIRPGRAITMTGDVEAAGGAHLLIEGCGGSADIILPVEAVPQPTLTANVDTTGGTITSTWSAVPSAGSAMLMMNTGFWADLAHVTSSPYTFTVASGVSVGAYRDVAITTFAPPASAASSFGFVNVWTGGFMMVFLR